MDSKQADRLIERKLKALEDDYNLTKKYDNLQPPTENPEMSLASALQEENVEIEKPKEDSDEDEFGEYCEYQQLDEDEKKPPADYIEPESIDHKNPFDTPLEVDLIKSIMSKIQLPTPGWAMSQEEWKQKMGFLAKENSQIQDDE